MSHKKRPRGAPPEAISRARLTAFALVVLLALVGAGTWWVTRATTQLSGQVVGLDGRPLSGVTVTFSGGGSETTSADGRFHIASRLNGGWATATGDGRLSRTRAIEAGHDTLIRLLPDDGRTVRLLFAGDVMFGRRYYDTNDNGDPSDGLLSLGASVEEHEHLLSDIAPLLRDADLSVVNLESPLADYPWFPSTAPRPPRFHNTKEFVFASAPRAALALRNAGIDVVGLGNNHQYDLLEAGVTSTEDALMQAGYKRSDFTGLGKNVNEAWQPAIRDVGGQRVAIVACTTITGSEHPVDYVASASKGGAAQCESSRLATTVRSAADHGAIVVAMIHGGFEYERKPSEAVRYFSHIARNAGALLVVDAHPHVTGGIDASSTGLTAWTMGNLLFDQTVWPTFNSYALRVDVRDGAIADAYTEPFMIDGYRPFGVVGSRADWVARQAQSLSAGPWVVDDGSLLLDETGLARTRSLGITAPVSGGSDPVLDLGGTCLPDPTGHVAEVVGRDELWTGDFEDLSPGDPSARGAFWNIAAGENDRQLLPQAAANGAYGVRLTRTGGKRDDIILTPRHRLLVKPGEQVTILLKLRGNAANAASAQLSWYNDTKGTSQEQTIVPLPVESDWRTLRIDVTVPQHAVAAGLYIRLAPQRLARVEMDIDDISWIGWHEAGSMAACDYARFNATTQLPALDLQLTTMPGPGNATPDPTWISADVLPVARPEPLSPGPPDSGWGSTE
jgi:hypothetical protein